MEAAPEFKNESQEKLALLATLQGKEIESLRPLRFLRRGTRPHRTRFLQSDAGLCRAWPRASPGSSLAGAAEV